MASAHKDTASTSADDHMLTPEDWARVGRQRKTGRKLMRDAKVRARGDLDIHEWGKDGWAFDTNALKEPKPRGYIAREHASSLTVEAFREKYEVPNMPVLISGCCDEWPAYQGAWHPRKLYKKYKSRRFKCGEDDDGYPVKVELKYFLRYLAAQRDDSPLYVFDSMYNEDKSSCGILQDYSVPKYFTDDLFRLVGEHRRPPYRWFLIGPARSGTSVHVDPLGTSAWNSLIYGRKRWVLFPPHIAREVVKAKAYVRPGEDDEAIDYFNTILPRIRAAGGAALTDQMIEFVQHPGETVFVPGGWHHAVINLDDTIAITQNFCSRINFERVWVEARDGRHGMARKWLRMLRTTYPALAAKADALNAKVGWTIEAEAARHAERVKEARAAKERRKATHKVEEDDGASSSSSSSSSSSGSSGSVTTCSSCIEAASKKGSSASAKLDAVHSGGSDAESASGSDASTPVVRTPPAERKRARRAVPAEE